MYKHVYTYLLMYTYIHINRNILLEGDNVFFHKINDKYELANSKFKMSHSVKLIPISIV